MKQALLITAIMLLAVSMTFAEVPKLISYQGRFSDAGTPVADGAYPVTFTIYDQATGGTVLWTEIQNVTITGGLFSVLLGAVNPVATSVFSWPACYLGIKLGANPEMTPRPRLAAVPYALTADSARTVGDKFVKLDGDTMTGPLAMIGSDGSDIAKLSQEGAYAGHFELMYNRETRVNVNAGENGGGINIKDSLGHSAVSLFMNGLGGQLRLANANGNINILLDGSGTGTVTLPENSIDARALYNGTGIASNQSTSVVTLTTTTADVLTVTITTPSLGYVYVTARGTAYLEGTTGVNYGYAQIDETAGGAVTAPYYTAFGGQAIWTTSATYWPFEVTRVFTKSDAGSYTFRLEGRVSANQGTGAVVEIHNTMIQAIYIPKSY